MKGILLAGGTGSRLYPATAGIVKQLLPIYDKPMIYYPLSVLMLSGIREILIISTPRDTERIRDILKDGSQLGISISYAIQEEPRGIAEAFIIGREFIGKDNVCLILGDNLIYGDGLTKLLQDSILMVEKQNVAVIFSYYVQNPKAYGVVQFDKDMKVISIEEKPDNPKSNYAVIGLYFYPNDVVEIAKSVRPSKRGELEITTINQEYLKQGRLYVELLGRGYAWLDAGNPQDLLEASNFIEIVERRQGLKIGCIEEIAYRKNYITKEELVKLLEKYPNNSYRKYLERIVAE
ncbi:MAG: glucose-1-phosphate thymidylyltransferase RfbA [Candidatus Calescibacterium sp.]|nr:glucose-1-phosphate thymidylyltransferase RfbA [Candidatus Calescibacterium sp.]